MIAGYIILCTLLALFAGAFFYVLGQYVQLSLKHTAEIQTLYDVWRCKQEEIEKEWRQREQKLVDKLIRKSGVSGLNKIEMENVVKFPDPEIPPPSWLDQAWEEDYIKEQFEIENSGLPDVANMTAEDAKFLHPMLWEKAKRNYKQSQVPLRVVESSSSESDEALN